MALSAEANPCSEPSIESLVELRDGLDLLLDTFGRRKRKLRKTKSTDLVLPFSSSTDNTDAYFFKRKVGALNLGFMKQVSSPIDRSNPTIADYREENAVGIITIKGPDPEDGEIILGTISSEGTMNGFMSQRQLDASRTMVLHAWQTLSSGEAKPLNL